MILPKQQLHLFQARTMKLTATTLLLIPILLLAAKAQPVPEIDILSPDGGEQFTGGSTISVVWTGLPSDEAVDLSVTCDGGATWETIAENVLGPRYLWQIPERDMGATCRLRVTATNLRAKEPRFVREFTGHRGNVNSVDIDPSGKWLVTGGADKKLIMRKIATGDVEWSIDAHESLVILVRFSRDGKRVVSASVDGTARVWDAEDGKLLYTLGSDRGVVWPADFSPDGNVVAVGNGDGSISWYDVSDWSKPGIGRPLRSSKVHESDVRYLEFSRDGRQIFASSTDGTGTIVNARNGEVIQRFDHGGGTANVIQVSHDGTIAVTIGYDGNTKFWNAETGELIRSKRYHEGARGSEVRISPDGSMISAAGYNGTTPIVNLDGEILFNVPGKRDGAIRSAFTPDSRFVAISHFNGTVSFWELTSPVLAYSDSEWRIEVCNQLDTSVEELDEIFERNLDLW